MFARSLSKVAVQLGMHGVSCRDVTSICSSLLCAKRELPSSAVSSTSCRCIIFRDGLSEHLHEKGGLRKTGHFTSSLIAGSARKFTATIRGWIQGERVDLPSTFRNLYGED